MSKDLQFQEIIIYHHFGWQEMEWNSIIKIEHLLFIDIYTHTYYYTTEILFSIYKGKPQNKTNIF